MGGGYRLSNLVPTILYENSSGGTTNDITLKESASNFEYIEIFYTYGSDSQFGANSVKIHYPTQKTANSLLCIYDGYSCQMMMLTVEISNNQATTIEYGLIDIYQNIVYNDRKYIRIYRILGYKSLKEE